MDLKSYFNGLPNDVERAKFAAGCGISLGHLRNCIYGNRTLSPAACAGAERASSGAVTRKELRPDDWRFIWTELAETEEA